VPELAGLQGFSVWWKHNDSIRGSDLFCGWYFASETIGKRRLEQKSLYNFGKQSRWHADAHYERIRYAGIYPSVDLILSPSCSLNTASRLALGAAAKAIRIRYEDLEPALGQNGAPLCASQRVRDGAAFTAGIAASRWPVRDNPLQVLAERRRGNYSSWVLIARQCRSSSIQCFHSAHTKRRLHRSIEYGFLEGCHAFAHGHHNDADATPTFNVGDVRLSGKWAAQRAHRYAIARRHGIGDSHDRGLGDWQYDESVRTAIASVTVAGLNDAAPPPMASRAWIYATPGRGILDARMQASHFN
jgi:hypothetical protein